MEIQTHFATHTLHTPCGCHGRLTSLIFPNHSIVMIANNIQVRFDSLLKTFVLTMATRYVYNPLSNPESAGAMPPPPYKISLFDASSPI